MAKIQNHLNASQQSKKSQKKKKEDTNEIQHPPNYVKCKTKQKEMLAWFLCLKRNGLFCHFLIGLLLKKWQETLEEQIFFFVCSRNSWKLLPWIINTIQGIKFCSPYILSTVNLCLGTNTRTKPELGPGHSKHFRDEEESADASWRISRLMPVRGRHFLFRDISGI